MMLLNVPFGAVLFMPPGWIYIISVIVLESFVASRYLKHKNWDKNLFLVLLSSNLLSGLIGLFIGLFLNLAIVFWTPIFGRELWDFIASSGILLVFSSYLGVMLATILLEFLFNWLLLQKTYHLDQIFKMTILVNIASYILTSILILLILFL